MFCNNEHYYINISLIIIICPLNIKYYIHHEKNKVIIITNEYFFLHRDNI